VHNCEMHPDGALLCACLADLLLTVQVYRYRRGPVEGGDAWVGTLSA
jgi:hypothetical protein